MINIENKYFLLLIPLVVLLFVLDRNKGFQYVYKLSLFKILQGKFLYASFYLEKVLLYSILSCLILILTGIRIRVPIGNEIALIFNVPYMDSNVLLESKSILKQYEKELSKFNLYINNHYIGKYSTLDFGEQLFERKEVFDNFYVETVRIDSRADNIKVFVIKFCNISNVEIDGNTYKICIKGLNNVGIVKKTSNYVFLFNYYDTDRKVNIKANNEVREVSIPYNNVVEIGIPENIIDVQILEQDKFLSDNYFADEPLRVYVSDGLTYTRKSLVSLGYNLIKSDRYDLCVCNTHIQCAKLCRYIWLLSPIHSDLYRLTNLENGSSLLLNNLNVPSNFDINRIIFKNISGIDINEYNKMIPFVTTNKGDTVMGLYVIGDRKYIVNGFNWEETTQTNFAHNVESPLPVFVDSVLRYLFPEHYSARDTYIGGKLFSYYNNDFPNVVYKNIMSQPYMLALNAVFQYMTFILFVFYILFKIVV